MEGLLKPPSSIAAAAAADAARHPESAFIVETSFFLECVDRDEFYGSQVLPLERPLGG